jgi:hypothetical protein
MLQLQRATFEVHLDRRAEFTKEIEQLAHVGDIGHAVQQHRLVSEQRGAQHRQHRVLVGRRNDVAPQGATAVHDQVAHGKGSQCWGEFSLPSAGEPGMKCVKPL